MPSCRRRPATSPSTPSTGAVAVAEQIGGEAGRALHAGATSAFVDGLHTTSLVAAGFAAAGALIALLFLPARAATGDPVDDTPSRSDDTSSRSDDHPPARELASR